MPARLLVGHPRFGFQERGERDRGVIHQPLADAEQRVPHRNTEIAKVAARSDAGAHQMRRRVDGAGRENDLAAAELRQLAR